MSGQLYPVYAAGPSPRTQLPLNTSQLAGPGVASRRWRAAGPTPRAEAPAGSASATSRRAETDNAAAARTTLLPPNCGIVVVAATKKEKAEAKAPCFLFLMAPSTVYTAARSIDDGSSE